VFSLRRRKMRKRRAARMATAKGTPTPTPTLKPRLEVGFPVLVPLIIAATLAVVVVSWLIFKGKVCKRPTLTAHSYCYWWSSVTSWAGHSPTWANYVTGIFRDRDNRIS
jgi:hypothetical protein